MKATELRIGNWVIFNPDNGEFIVSEINCFGSNNLINGLNAEDISPIPLTEEWLVKFGIPKTIDWVWLDSEYCITLEFVNVCGQDTNGRYEIWVYFDNALLKQVEYVHQLQNLYYTLTGKEI